MAEEKTLAEMEAYLQNVTEELLMTKEMDNLEMYRVITEKGKELEGITPDEQVDSNYVYGCVSNVYIVDEVDGGRMRYRGSSEAHIVKGLLAYMVEALNGLKPEDVVSGTGATIERFAADIDLKATLTPNRANAFGNIYQLMVKKASVRMEER